MADSCFLSRSCPIVWSHGPIPGHISCREPLPGLSPLAATDVAPCSARMVSAECPPSSPYTEYSPSVMRLRPMSLPPQQPLCCVRGRRRTPSPPSPRTAHCRARMRYCCRCYCRYCRYCRRGSRVADGCNASPTWRPPMGPPSLRRAGALVHGAQGQQEGCTASASASAVAAGWARASLPVPPAPPPSLGASSRALLTAASSPPGAGGVQLCRVRRDGRAAAPVRVHGAAPPSPTRRGGPSQQQKSLTTLHAAFSAAPRPHDPPGRPPPCCFCCFCSLAQYLT